MNQQKRIDIATSKLVIREPFFASLLLRLEIKETESIKTFATDGQQIIYNPGFAASLTDGELQTVLLHETAHVAYLHPYRRGSRDLGVFNQACDHVVNLDLKDQGFEMPADALCDPRFAGMAEEQVYAELTKHSKQPNPGKQPGGAWGQGSGGKDKPKQPSAGNQKGKGPTQPQQAPEDQAGEGDGQDPSEPPGMGEVMDAPGIQAERNEAQAKTEIAILQAAMAAKGQGRTPAFAQRLVDKIKHPEMRWDEALRNFLTARSNADWSWARPNPRYLHTGFILPSLRSHGMGTVIVAIDTSGSIGKTELEEFLGHCQSILDTCNPEKLILVQCDAEINDWRELQQGDSMNGIEMKGGGGTSHQAVTDRIESEGEQPACLVCLTDGYTTWPKREPPYPVLWAMTSDVKPPWGETVRIK